MRVVVPPDAEPIVTTEPVEEPVAIFVAPVTPVPVLIDIVVDDADTPLLPIAIEPEVAVVPRE